MIGGSIFAFLIMLSNLIQGYYLHESKRQIKLRWACLIIAPVAVYVITWAIRN